MESVVVGGHGAGSGVDAASAGTMEVAGVSAGVTRSDSMAAAATATAEAEAEAAAATAGGGGSSSRVAVGGGGTHAMVVGVPPGEDLPTHLDHALFAGAVRVDATASSLVVFPTSVRHLLLSGVAVDDGTVLAAGLASLCTRCPRLETLWLSHCDVPSATLAAAFQPKRGCEPRLRRVGLHNIEGADDAVLHSLFAHHAKVLVELSVACFDVSDAGFVALPQCKHLHKLSLDCASCCALLVLRSPWLPTWVFVLSAACELLCVDGPCLPFRSVCLVARHTGAQVSGDLLAAAAALPNIGTLNLQSA